MEAIKHSECIVKIFGCKNIRLSQMMGIYFEVTCGAVREMGFYTTPTAESLEINGSHASVRICPAYPGRKGHLGFKVAVGNRIFQGPSLAVL